MLLIYTYINNNMGGGVTPCLKLEPNIKCIIYSLLVGIIYWFTPKKNIAITLIIFLCHVMTNVLYDNYYRCQEHNTQYIRYIIFGLLFSIFIHFTPRKNYFILGAVLYFPYLIMAYYDFFFNCDYKKLQPSPLPFGRLIYVPFKPKDYRDREAMLCPDGKMVWDFIDRVAFFIIIGVLFVVVFGKMFTTS